LHERMFDQTWKWAGLYRLTEKNIGVPAHEIRERLMALLGGDFEAATSIKFEAMTSAHVRFSGSSSLISASRFAQRLAQQPALGPPTGISARPLFPSRS
jgi:hypothetical protein